MARNWKGRKNLEIIVVVAASGVAGVALAAGTVWALAVQSLRAEAAAAEALVPVKA